MRFLPLGAALLVPAVWGASAPAVGKTFPSPEEAVYALLAAVNEHSSNALVEIFGPTINSLKSADPVQAQNEFMDFAAGLKQSRHIMRIDSQRCILEIGDDYWPFAIPIVSKGGGWFFDTEAGKDELLNRRIGFNELLALEGLRAAAQAQREYAAYDHDGDEVLEFAQKIISTPGMKDGLYWSPDIDGEISPLGPAFADAQGEGYFKKLPNENAPQPFHGYFIKILTRQGKHAPGGAYDYVINGNMIGGFAFVAWPAQYGDSGVMTFIINQQGKVYQKDLGLETASVVKKMKNYDPDPSWTVSPD